jgi:hypothetical protein
MRYAERRLDTSTLICVNFGTLLKERFIIDGARLFVVYSQ